MVMDMDLNDIIRRIQLEGEITSDEVLRANIIKQALYKRSNLIATGTQILSPKPWKTLDAKWSFPTEVDGEFPVPEGAIAARSKPVEWVEWGGSMQMAEFRFMLTDFAKARQQEQLTYTAMVKRGSEYFAEVEDSQILDALYAGAGATTVTIAAGDEWDAAGVGTDPEANISEAWNNILDQSNVPLEEIKNVALIYPAKVDATLRGLKLIGNIQQSLMKYIGDSYGFSFHPTRYYDETGATKLQDDALMVVKGDETGIHGVYDGQAIPLSETWRVEGRGQEILTKKLFFTKIQPESQTVATSYRICKIANVI